VAGSIPPSRDGDIHHLAHPGGAEAEQRFRSEGIVSGNQRHGGHTGKAPNQLIDFINLALGTLVHGEEHGIDRPFPYGPHHLRHGVSVENGKAADTRRVETGPLGGG
jgi:hypothetical protein